MAIANATAIVFTALSAMLSNLSDFSPASVSSSQFYDPYWGPGNEPMHSDTSIRPFSIFFSDEMIEDLRYRLMHTRKPQASLENAKSTYGINGEYLAKVIEYWLYKYDFIEREEYLNQYPQYITKIQGLDIHYIHVKPQSPKNSKIQVLPLLLLHGWSGSLAEFYKIIPMLTTPSAGKDFVFEVIAPSLPGSGFSDAAAKIGFGPFQMATVLKNFMLRIGFNKFYTQGGDFGGVIIQMMASLYSESVLGIHSNFCLLFNPHTLVDLAYYSVRPSAAPEHERSHLPTFNQLLYGLVDRTGYFYEQSTRPDTIGVGLNDSPAGLAAYILEKFYELTNYNNRLHNDGNLLNYLSMDELIDNLMFYWVPGKITSSMRIYAEYNSIDSIKSRIHRGPVTVPTACVHFPHEILFWPEALLRTGFTNLVQRTIMPRGGHYAALEEPQLLADDIFAAISKMRKEQTERHFEKNQTEIRTALTTCLDDN